METGRLMRLVLAGLALGTSACHAGDEAAPRTSAAAWSRTSEQQYAAVQAVMDGQRKGAPAPVVFIDGKRYTETAPAGPFTIIDPTRIATVQALTGAEAVVRAGEAGRNGVIWITTKDGRGPGR